MGLKILHSADWHLDSPFAGFPEEQREFLRRKLREIPGKVAELARREGCHLVLLAGDVFDGEASRETVEAVKESLESCAVPVFIAPGNHDFCGPGSPWLEETWPENVHIFTGGMESVALPNLDCRIYGAGYKSMDCEGLLADFRAEDRETHLIGLLHGDPTTANSPCCPVTAAQVRSSGLDYLALGHIHKAGFFRAGQTLCAWPGCPMGRGWDETGDKGVCIVTLEDTAQVRAVPLELPCFYRLEGDAETLETLLPAVENENFYRIILTGSSDSDAQQLQKRLSRFPHLELVDRREAPVDLWADVGEDTLRGVYFRRLREISQEEPGAILAAEISRKLLEGREVRLP